MASPAAAALGGSVGVDRDGWHGAGPMSHDPRPLQRALDRAREADVEADLALAAWDAGAGSLDRVESTAQEATAAWRHYRRIVRAFRNHAAA